ncbi:Csu type fimbrial protein [Pseudomonas sp. RIT-To-2]|uniref:Csu type fimbrial protein n=1 Tax=Pseudomonas sp. RIT-To-2 TaxID=3462541 RepID=UPI0040476179
MVSVRLALSATLITTSAVADPAVAALSGQIQARLTITAGCEISSAGSTVPSGSMGNLDFGDQGPTWTAPIGASVSSGSNALQVACNPSVTGFSVTIDGGTNGDGTTRRLSNGSRTIAYQLYLNAAGTERYSIGEQKTFAVHRDGQIPIPIFGAVVANTSALPAGVYSDTLRVTLDW